MKDKIYLEIGKYMIILDSDEDIKFKDEIKEEIEKYVLKSKFREKLR